MVLEKKLLITGRNVCFNVVEVREYEVDLNDNPSCGLGPAVGLGWDYECTRRESLDEYEDTRGAKRYMHEIKMPKDVREDKLKKAGFSKKEISKYVQEKSKIKVQRSATQANLPFMPYEEKWEKFKRKAIRVIKFQEKDAELKKIWPEYKNFQEKVSITDTSSDTSGSVISS